MQLVVLCGLPGSGKSALARELARRCDAPVFDKDRVRDALFGPDHVAYSKEQDAFCCELLRAAALWSRDRAGASLAILDGRTYTRRADVEELVAFAAAEGLELRLVECVCSAATARARIERSAGEHPAADRRPELVDAVAARAEPIAEPRLVVDTERAPAAELAEVVLSWLGRG